MKRLFSFLLCIAILITTTSCDLFDLFDIIELTKKDDLTFSDKGHNPDELYYNGNTYVFLEDMTWGTLYIDWNEDLVFIGSQTFWLLSTTKIKYYAMDTDNPDFIIDDQGVNSIWVREDIDVTYNLPLSIAYIDEEVSFNLEDIIYKRYVKSTHEDYKKYNDFETYGYKHECDFFATIEPYPALKLWLKVTTIKGRPYIQFYDGCSYYRLKEDFYEKLVSLDQVGKTEFGPVETWLITHNFTAHPLTQ